MALAAPADIIGERTTGNEPRGTNHECLRVATVPVMKVYALSAWERGRLARPRSNAGTGESILLI